MAEATAATAEIFEAGVAADAQLTPQALEAMLRYQIEVRRASPHGWASGPLSLRQLAATMVYDEIAGTEAVLHSAMNKLNSMLAAHAAAAAAAAVRVELMVCDHQGTHQQSERRLLRKLHMALYFVAQRCARAPRPLSSKGHIIRKLIR